MTRGSRTRLAILLTTALASLAGCSGRDAPATGSATQTPAALVRVAATLRIPAAGNILATRDRLWVISGGTPVVTQIDPDTNTITKQVTLPHPVAYGTVAHGSLWLVSGGDNALVELDAESGKVRRTLEGSHDLPLDEPVGIDVTGGSLWVVNHHKSTLLRIDEQTGKLTQTITLAGDKAAGPYLVDHTLWIAMTAQGILHRVDPATGNIVGRPVHAPTGLCAAESIIGSDIWATSIRFGHFACTNGTSRFDTTSGEVTPLTSAEGKSLYTFARYAGRLWATDLHNTLYQVDPRTGTLRPAMTFDTKDANHLFAAFGSLWISRPDTGEVIRLQAT